MNDENDAKAFLNNKETPSPDDLMNLFFLDNKELLDEQGIDVDPEEIDFELLGEADEVRTEKGSEWLVTRLGWDTPDGYVYRINIIKVNEFNNQGQYAVRPLFPFGELEDIDYEEVFPQSYDELLEIAIDNEDFEEAARLRDWDKDLKALLLTLKPKIEKAIKDENVERLDELLTQIRVYRSTLQ
tara:strand:- start:75327 stop:75881 length:555 start_codon:yes stop_codon:yes gene_type:complete